MRWCCATQRRYHPGRLVEVGRRFASASHGVLGIHRTTIPTWPWPTPSPPWRPAARTCRAPSTGYGERLATRICAPSSPSRTEAGHNCIGRENLEKLASVARFIAELGQPSAGPTNGRTWVAAHRAQGRRARQRSAQGTPLLTNTVRPEARGQPPAGVLSDLSGRGNVLYKLKQHGLGERWTRRPGAVCWNASSTRARRL